MHNKNTFFITDAAEATVNLNSNMAVENPSPEILFITSYPPRECGIATYSQDLIKALNNKFDQSFKIKICALESDNEKHVYTDEVGYLLNVDTPNSFIRLAKKINENDAIKIVLIQHEFGFYQKKENKFSNFLLALTKPIVIVFHTVLPHPDEKLKAEITKIAGAAESIIVMTNSSANILMNEYNIDFDKITIIPHGTHLVAHLDKHLLKNKYQLSGKKVLSTFGLLSAGKSIETSLKAMPAIIKENKDVIFLIIGKTHPTVVKQEGYQYRNMLDELIKNLGIENYVRYVNYYLPLPELLEYLQLTDVYLFTSKDPDQAVSGTFSYALSSGCPIVSTPIPHTKEVLKNDGGLIIDFENYEQLSTAVNTLLADDVLRENISLNGLRRMASTAWENAAISHAMLFQRVSDEQILLKYNLPEVNLDHIKKMTTGFGIIQFSKFNHPDIYSGYTVDDNARALVAMCQHYELTGNEADLYYINIYFNFLQHCLQANGNFLNYVNEEKIFTEQNVQTNIEDSSGRAIWALGYLISMKGLLPDQLIDDSTLLVIRALKNIKDIHSTRAMAFIIKGLFYLHQNCLSFDCIPLIKEFGTRLVQMYRHEADNDWKWFESYLTYANSILPEAMLCAWLATGDLVYKKIANLSFEFLLSKIFRGDCIKVISNRGWSHKAINTVLITNGGEQPIDVAYTILALSKFYDVFKNENYKLKMDIAFSWFLGNNHLHQIIYNPCTGGCYDGLEEADVNLNQGAESTVSYLMARLTIEKYNAMRIVKTDVQLTVDAKNQFMYQ